MLKKIVESFDIADYEVLTDIGYIDIEKLLVTEQYQVYEVVFETCKIKCADKHIFIGEDDSEIYAQDAKGKKIKTKYGVEECLEFNDLGYKETMYDLHLKEYHKYYTNDILSHNTTVIGGYLLHMAIFNKNFTIACLANKLEQAQEILTRIQDSYEGLPWFLQMGVKVWNKRSMTLGNGTKVYVAATTKNAVRGKSINCLGGDTPITVERKDTSERKIITLQDLEQEYHAELFGKPSIS